LDAHRRYFAPEIETMPRAELDALQEEKLFGDLLPWAYEHSTLLRETWDAAGVTPDDITTFAQFRARVPFIDKDAIRRFRKTHRDPYGGLLCVDLNTPGVFSAVFSTSGTTGEPTPAPYAGRGPSMLTREFWELGSRPGDHFTHMLFTFRGPASTTPSAASGPRRSLSTTTPPTSSSSCASAASCCRRAGTRSPVR
jgi:phenylacetate-CoA ligase